MSTWDHTTDVVIVGSGGGGLVAALVGRSLGLDVLIVEKTEFIGGSTAMSGGGIWAPNNALMRAKGVPDSESDALAYFDAVVGDVGPASSPERRRAYVENVPRMVALLQVLGIPFRYADGYPDYYTEAPGGKARGRTIEALPFDTAELGPWRAKLRPGMTMGVRLVGFGTELSALSYYNRSPKDALVAARVMARTWAGRARGRTLVANGGALAGRLLQLVVQHGADLWTEAPLHDLVVEDGRVVGAVVSRNGRDQRIAARRGVLLAAGGFSRNNEMRARYGGSNAHSAEWSRSNPGETGEVLEMGIALGAATDLLDEAIWLPGPCLPDGSPPRYPPRPMSAFGRARWRPGSILVDSAGQRFGDEAMSHMELGQLMFARNRQVPTIPSWLVFDDAFRRRSLFGPVPGRLPEQWITDGFIKRAGTLAELASQCAIDAMGLEATVRRFNEFARTGVDSDFHRGDSAYDRYCGDPAWRPNNCLAPLDRPPFYAAAHYPCDLGTLGGLLTDDRGRVLRPDGQSIPGLHATGNVTASVIGRHYLGAGASIGATCTFGFVAMHDIAEQSGTQV